MKMLGSDMRGIMEKTYNFKQTSESFAIATDNAASSWYCLLRQDYLKFWYLKLSAAS